MTDPLTPPPPTSPTNAAAGRDFKTVAILGLGLIGSSLALGLRRRRPDCRLIGFSRSQRTRDEAQSLDLVHEIAATPEACVAQADCAVLAIPVGGFGELAQRIAPALKPGAVVTDVGSVKRAVIDAVAPCLPDSVAFVPAHPIAGTEESGPSAGFAELFHGRWCILTPAPDADAHAVASVAAMWRDLGMSIEHMTPERHDLTLAVVSHVPHLTSFSLVGTSHDLEFVTQSEIIKFSASGFRDFTRLAASDPVMWRDIFLHNRDCLIEVLGRFIEDLTVLQRAIRRRDGETLFQRLSETRAVRRHIIAAGQDVPDPDFGRGRKPPPPPVQGAKTQTPNIDPPSSKDSSSPKKGR